MKLVQTPLGLKIYKPSTTKKANIVDCPTVRQRINRVNDLLGYIGTENRFAIFNFTGDGMPNLYLSKNKTLLKIHFNSTGDTLEGGYALGFGNTDEWRYGQLARYIQQKHHHHLLNIFPSAAAHVEGSMTTFYTDFNNPAFTNCVLCGAYLARRGNDWWSHGELMGPICCFNSCLERKSDEN